MSHTAYFSGSDIVLAFLDFVDWCNVFHARAHAHISCGLISVFLFDILVFVIFQWFAYCKTVTFGCS